MPAIVIPAPNANVKKSDIINNLTSTETQKPLSAAQGKALNDLVAQSTAFDTLFHNVNNVSGTTDANGNLLLPVVATGERHAVIFAWDGTHVFIPFYYSGNWYCRVQYSNAVGDPYANQNVTCSYYYI